MPGMLLVLFWEWLDGKRWCWVAPQDTSVVVQREWSRGNQVGPELAVQKMTARSFIPLSMEEQRSVPTETLNTFFFYWNCSLLPPETESPWNVQSFNFSIFSIIWCIDCVDRCIRGCFWFQDKLPVSQLHQTRIFHKHLFIPGVFSSMSRLAHQRVIYLMWMQYILQGGNKAKLQWFCIVRNFLHIV